MNEIAYYDANGQYVWVGNSTLVVKGAPPPPAHPLEATHQKHEGKVDLQTQYHDVIANKPRKIPKKLNPAHTFDWNTKEWVDPRTIIELRQAKWTEVKRWREQAAIAPLLQTQFGIFDANEKAISTIKDTVAGLTASSALGKEPKTIRWTMADENPERYVTLTPNELREVRVLLMNRATAAHDHSRVLFDEIQAAITLEALDAITWNFNV